MHVICLQQAQNDLETQAKLEAAQGDGIMSSIRDRRRTKKQQGDAAVVKELKNKQRAIREKKVLNREDVYHGALEDILLGKHISRIYF